MLKSKNVPCIETLYNPFRSSGVLNCRFSYTISNSCTRWFELSLNEGLDRYLIRANADGLHCWFVVDENGQLCEIATPLENPPDPELWRKIRAVALLNRKLRTDQPLTRLQSR